MELLGSPAALLVRLRLVMPSRLTRACTKLTSTLPRTRTCTAAQTVCKAELSGGHERVCDAQQTR